MTSATVERFFSKMKLIKTSLCSTLGEDTLEHTMHISIEEPDCLCDDDLKLLSIITRE